MKGRQEGNLALDLFEYPIRVVEAETGYCYDGLYTNADFDELIAFQINHLSRAKWVLLLGFIVDHPFMSLLAGLLVLVLGGVLLGIFIEAVLVPVIDYLLGDWGDVCISNCQENADS
ncbi:hypothetical protein [Polycladidibacter stylochi]|uniref:hypothetical protein n=1 Tax=Polycladidibacter stylochi TaxID=1807766 RepID=UPI000829918D|nr:hypothetical protein [Pseudovibrio stylochi]